MFNSDLHDVNMQLMIIISLIGILPYWNTDVVLVKFNCDNYKVLLVISLGGVTLSMLVNN